MPKKRTPLRWREPAPADAAPEISLRNDFRSSDEFLNGVRALQRATDKSGVTGEIGLTPAEKDFVYTKASALRQHPDCPQRVRNDPQTLDKTLMMFTEMCRRRKVAFPRDIEPIFLNLAQELDEVSQALDLSIADARGFALYQGREGLRKLQEPAYADICQKTWILKRAATLYPAFPFRYLDDVVAAYTALRDDPKIKDYAFSTQLLLHAATHQRKDVRLKLIERGERAQRLQKKPAFSMLADAPSVFRDAVILHPANPAGYLNLLIDEIRRLKTDPDLACFSEQPGIYKYAVLHYGPEKAGQYLRDFRDGKIQISNYTPPAPASDLADSPSPP